MAEPTEVIQKRCGQIIFLSADNIALNCEFCHHDFFTFEALRAHIDEHFPDLPSNIKTESFASCGRFILSDVQDNDISTENLQGNRESQSIEAAGNDNSTLHTNGVKKSEQSKGNERRRQPQRSCNVEPTDVNKLTKPVRKSATKQASSGEKTCSSKPNIIKSRSILKKIVESHDKLKCSICEKKFTCHFYLKHHTRENHLPDSDPRRYYPCELCDVKLKSYVHLRSHTRNKHRTDIYTCEHCQKQFKSKKIIEEHMEVHSPIRPSCTYCQKKFVYKRSKRKHEPVCPRNTVPKQNRKNVFE